MSEHAQRRSHTSWHFTIERVIVQDGSHPTSSDSYWNSSVKCLKKRWIYYNTHFCCEHARRLQPCLAALPGWRSEPSRLQPMNSTDVATTAGEYPAPPHVRVSYVLAFEACHECTFCRFTLSENDKVIQRTSQLIPRDLNQLLWNINSRPSMKALAWVWVLV